MSSLQTHLDNLKKFVAPDPLDGVNKLYFLEVVEKPGLVKIGDTHRLVETRNDETLTNASLHRSKPVTWVVAKNYNNRTFRDKSFHKFLEKKGYKRELNDNGSKSEWFHISLDHALIELKEFTGKPVFESVILRPVQHYLLEQEQQAINDGYQYINAGYCMRSGKTIISLTTADNNDWMPVYLGKNLTSQSSAENDNRKYGIVPEMLTQSLHGVDELGDGEVSKKVKSIIKNINKANVANKDLVFYIDEVDDSSHTKKSRDIIVPVIEHFKKTGRFALIKTMSGTRVYRGEKVLRELAGNDAIKEISLEYYEMQILQPESTCRREFRHISFYSENADGLTNISDAMKNKDNGHKSLATVIERLLGTNNFEFTVDPNFPHWFIKFSTVGKDNANALVRYLNRNYSLIEHKEHHYAGINGDVTSSRKAEDYCKKIIDDNPNKICVFITQVMATTSFSVTGLGTSVVFTDNELTADDIQALHRSVTWTEGKEYGNQIVITTNDSMEHSFDDIFEDETKVAKTRADKIAIYRELLYNNSMVHFTISGNSVRPVRITQENADKVIDQKAKAMTQIASIMNVIHDLDEEILDHILLTVSGKKNSTMKSSSTKGNKFNPFGDQDNKTNSTKQDSGQVTSAQKEKILRAFVEASVYVPAVAREQGTDLENFDFWAEIGVSKELFFDVYNSSWMFKDRIDSIYNLCENEKYLVQNYISKMS